MMELDEAIKHAEEVAEEKREQAGFDTDNERYRMSESEKADCLKCAAEYRQLAEWLKELKALREKQSPLDISLLVQKVIEILPDVVDSVVDNIPTYINEKLKCQNCDWYKEQRPHGEWVRYIDDNDGFVWAKCSLCQWDSGEPFGYAIDRFSFCPNCGARMQKEGEAE